MSIAFSYRVTETLRDGGRIVIRSIRPDDKSRLLEHFHKLSELSIYHRFFGHKRSLDDNDLRNLTELDFVNHVGLTATIGSGAEERFIGVGRYLRDDDEAEVAFAVLDEHQGRGIGTTLLHHLGRIARQSGIKRFSAHVMGDNQQMLEVFANSGYHSHERYQSGEVRVSLDLDQGTDQ